jgi:NAD(P)-dependent dehydrogenase (short-subunit alcohol dehydrogenase family)
MELHSANCVVTGAASGIGRAVAERLLADGAGVVAVDVDRDRLASVAAAGAVPVEADLATTAGRRAVWDACPHPTHLVNAAGVIHLEPLADVPEAHWDETFAVNARAVFFLTQLLGPALPRGGAVVNVASVAGKTGSTVEAAVYSASKAAVLSITRTFAHAWAGRGVRVNAVCPGVVDTPMNDRVLAGVAAARAIPAAEVDAARIRSVPLGRAASAGECAGVIRFLLSDEAAYMTGQAVNISGGLVTW